MTLCDICGKHTAAHRRIAECGRVLTACSACNELLLSHEPLVDRFNWTWTVGKKGFISACVHPCTEVYLGIGGKDG